MKLKRWNYPVLVVMYFAAFLLVFAAGGWLLFIGTMLILFAREVERTIREKQESNHERESK